MFTLREEWAGIVLGTYNMFTLREVWAGIVLGTYNMFTLRDRVCSNCRMEYTICSL